MLSRRRIVTAVGVALLATACGGREEPNPTSAAQPTPTAASPPAAACEPDSTDLALTAKSFQFDTSCLAVPALEAFTVTLFNKSNNETHSFAISELDFTPVFKGKAIGGGEEISYEIEGLPAGIYTFLCEIHPGLMTGDFVVA